MSFTCVDCKEVFSYSDTKMSEFGLCPYCNVLCEQKMHVKKILIGMVPEEKFQNLENMTKFCLSLISEGMELDGAIKLVAEC